MPIIKYIHTTTVSLRLRQVDRGIASYIRQAQGEYFAFHFFSHAVAFFDRFREVAKVIEMKLITGHLTPVLVQEQFNFTVEIAAPERVGGGQRAIVATQI